MFAAAKSSIRAAIPRSRPTCCSIPACVGRAAVPSGASTGSREAVELRDGEPSATAARACSRPSRTSTARSATSPSASTRRISAALDGKLIAADGTENKSKLGANAILAVSLAAAHAAARDRKLPLYRHLGGSRRADPAGAA